MPLPKRRHSKTRGKKRRTHWKLAVPALVECRQCHQKHRAHHVCPYCGYYAGKPVTEPEEV